MASIQYFFLNLKGHECRLYTCVFCILYFLWNLFYYFSWINKQFGAFYMFFLDFDHNWRLVRFAAMECSCYLVFFKMERSSSN